MLLQLDSIMFIPWLLYSEQIWSDNLSFFVNFFNTCNYCFPH